MFTHLIKGFSLLEFLFVFCLTAILLIMGVGSLQSPNREKQLLITEISRTIQYAKIQAWQLNKPVYLSSRDWSQGVALYSKDKMGKPQKIYQWQWHHPTFEITAHFARGSPSLRLYPSLSQAASNGRFILLHKPSQRKTMLLLNRLGRVRIVEHLGDRIYANQHLQSLSAYSRADTVFGALAE